MKALIATAYGPPGRLTIADVAVPRPGPGQVQVRVAAASFNPPDIRAATGGFGDSVPLKFPYTLGMDFAGTVTELGTGVTGYATGDEVFGWAMPYQLRASVAGVGKPSLTTGTLADYAVFEADTALLAHRPATLSVDRAASLGVVGMTAQALIATARIQPGESVLIIGATGGVGTSVVPLLAAEKATVVATGATTAGGDLLRALGADRVIGHDQAGYPVGVDVVLNLALFPDRMPAAARAVRPGGRLLSIVAPMPTALQLGRDDISFEFVMDSTGQFGGMRAIGEAAAAGRLTTTIDRSFTLADGVQAAVHFATGHPLGKVVVTT